MNWFRRIINRFASDVADDALEAAAYLCEQLPKQNPGITPAQIAAAIRSIKDGAWEHRGDEA